MFRISDRASFARLATTAFIRNGGHSVRRFAFTLALLALIPAGLSGCGSKDEKAAATEKGSAAATPAGKKPVNTVGTIRLVDVFDDAEFEEGGEIIEVPPPTQWTFGDQEEGTRGWSGDEIEGELTVRDGRLAGRSKGDHPIIFAQNIGPRDATDQVHSVEIRMKVSAGKEMGVSFQKSLKANPESARGPLSQALTTPLIPGTDVHTYLVRCTNSKSGDEVRQVLFRPTDADGADFEIESIRLIYMKEYLAQIPAGVNWQGLGEIYHETIVARAPERTVFNLTLPARPWLDLSLGTIETEPVTFRLGIARDGAEITLLERAVTSESGWTSEAVDLSDYATAEVKLTLALVSDKAGAIGFWGSPAVRNRLPAKTETAANVPQGVILIMADTLRRDHLTPWGYERETAPAIARMASEGVVFEDCIAQASWTKVSTPSIMTSLHPRSHTVKDLADRLPGSATTIAEVYRDAGYATISYSSIMFTGQFTNLHQGFEELHEYNSVKGAHSTKTAHTYADRFITWLKAHPEDPFFCFFHVFDPHDPYETFEPWSETWTTEERRKEQDRRLSKLRPKIAHPFLKMLGMPSRAEAEESGIDIDEFLRFYRDDYDNSILGMDAQIGKLLDHLRETGLDKKVVVAFVSDHGEEFMDHSRCFHGHSIYGEMVNVPLIFWGPGFVETLPAQTATVQTLNIMPTLLDSSRLNKPDGLQAESLWRDLAAGAKRADIAATSAFSEKAALQGRFAPNGEWESYSVIQDGWKLIHNVIRVGDMPEFELFDHKADPLNHNNLADRHPDRVKSLATALDDHLKQADAAKLKTGADAVKGMSDEDLKRLRSLGYL